MPCAFVAGGARRQDSVRLGVDALPVDLDIVLIHDAVRPFASRHLIDRVIAGVEQTGAAVPALAARDTVKHIDVDRGLVRTTIPRGEIWLAQTPQGFRRSLLKAAIAGAGQAEATDDAMLAEQAGMPVRVVAGDVRNIKITTPDDLAAARAGLAAVPRVGTGYDLHRLVDGRPLVLAGVVLAPDRGPLGHSDGDVVCHALADALFGAAGEGDVGQHFPNTDPAWKDAPGLDLLRRAATIVAASGFAVSSADVTVVLERPRLVPHLAEIRRRLAAALDVDAGRVSVKGKTNEGMDAVGRGEAIAAHAVVVLAPSLGR
jgi:2-C-methyl-D-erythritol 4-phosphate cytidylyltransferase/2-C-methyl-D-erythritol 2,4-cyclodiphosphate synthase